MTRSIIILLGLFSALLLPTLVASIDEAAGSVNATVTIALTISDVSASSIGYHGATISWKTNGNATSQVFYDTSLHDNIADYAYHTDNDTGLASEHSLALTSLSSSTTYHYRVKSVAVVDSTEFIAISGDYTFTTLTLHTVSRLPITPPPPPPGTTDVSDIVTDDGVFTKGVIAESIDSVCELAIDEGTVGLIEAEPLSEISITEMEVPLPQRHNLNVIGLVYDFEPDGATFSPPITLTFHYDPDLIPAGVAEENLVIAMWDEEAGEWVNLVCTVDPVVHVITASVSHFTPFAVIAYTFPAAFTASDLTISPTVVDIGETVTVTTMVTNAGDLTGSYTVVLKIDNVRVATEEVTLTGGASHKVTFTTFREVAGTYAISVDGLSGTFTVREAVPPPPPPVVVVSPPAVPPKPIHWWLVGGIIAAVVVVGLGIFLLARRRA